MAQDQPTTKELHQNLTKLHQQLRHQQWDLHQGKSANVRRLGQIKRQIARCKTTLRQLEIREAQTDGS